MPGGHHNGIGTRINTPAGDLFRPPFAQPGRNALVPECVSVTTSTGAP
jgi:hypothetical protein